MTVVANFKSPVSGKIQLSAFDGFNLGLSNYGGINLVAGSGASPLPMVYGSVTVSGSTPIMAFSANAYVNIYRMDVSGSNFTFYFRAQSSVTVPLEWWSFDVASMAIKNPNVGIFRLKDLTGVETFSSAMWPLRLVGERTTQKATVDYPAGPGDDLTDIGYGTAPSGRKYAIVQSTPAFIYNNYSEESDLQAPGELPPGQSTTYRNTQISLHSVGRVNGQNFEMGNEVFEYWSDLSNSQISPTLNVRGRSRHVVVDVTDFPSASAPGIGTVNVNVNATSRSVTGSGATTVTTTTATVTGSASGGVAPYTYRWERVSGDSETNVAPSVGTGKDSNVFATTASSQPQGTIRQAIWRLKVTDAQGSVGYSPDVTFTHTAQVYSNSVTSWSSWPNRTVNTTSNYGGVGDFPAVTITGPTVPVVLRFKVSNYTGNLAAIGLYVEKNGSAYDNFNITANQTGQIEVTVAAGDTVRVWTDGQTLQGAKSGGYRLTVTNQTASGAPVLSTTDFTFNVDTDNDYNRIAAWTTADQSRSSTADYYGTAIPDKTIAGIVSGSPRTVRLTMSGVSSNVPSTGLYLYRNGVSVGFKAWSNGYIEATFANGDVLGVYADGSTDVGTRSGSFVLTLTDQSDTSSGSPRVISTWNNSVTVDSDNSSFSDYVPDAFDIPNLNTGSTANDGITFQVGAPNYRYITGINRTINMRAKITSYTGNASQVWAELQLYREGTGSAITNMTFGLNNQMTWTATNGQGFFFGGYIVSANAGRQTGSMTVSIYNDSVSTTSPIDTFVLQWDIDTDNSTIPPDYTPDPLGFTSMSGSTTAEYMMHASGWKSVTGINQPITLRATILSSTGNIPTSNRGAYMWRNDGTNQYMNWTNGNYVQLSFTNGQQIALNVDAVTGDGTRSGSVTIRLSNETTGTVIGDYTFTFTVDSDNSSAPADYTPDPISWSNATFSTTSNYDGCIAGTRYVTGINQTIQLRASISSQGGNGQMNAAGIYFYKNGSSLGSFEWLGTPGGTISGNFVNGDNLDIMVDMQSWGAYRATANCVVTITNVTTGATFATWSVNGTVFSNKPNA